MLTLPIEAAPGARTEPRVLIIGRSENVLSETVHILRLTGHAAGASNNFAGVVGLFDMAAVDVVVFGGMVPPDAKERLRQEISSRNPAITFVQGFAGIPGVIAGRAARGGHGTDRGRAPARRRRPDRRGFRGRLRRLQPAAGRTRRSGSRAVHPGADGGPRELGRAGAIEAPGHSSRHQVCESAHVRPLFDSSCVNQ